MVHIETKSLYLTFTLSVALGVLTSRVAPAQENSIATTYLEQCKNLELNEFNRNPYHLSEAQSYALFYYTALGFEIMNPALAKDETEDLDFCNKTSISLIDSALDLIPDTRATVYRGALQAHFPNLRVGSEVTFKAFTSTSTNREDAENFVKDRLWIIEGVKGKKISSYSNAPHEDELLFKRGTKLRVENITHQNFLVFGEGPEDPITIQIDVVHAKEITE